MALCTSELCCQDVRRCCFGKRHDALYCYNDDKAKICPSAWHPRNPRFFGLTPEKNSKIQFKDKTVRINEKATCKCNCNDSEDSAILKSSRKKYKDPNQKELKQIIWYIRNCLRQRLSVHWTEDDEEELLESVYHHIAAMKGHQNVMDTIERLYDYAIKHKNNDITSFLQQIKKYVRRNTFDNNSYRTTRNTNEWNRRQCSNHDQNDYNNIGFAREEPKHCTCVRCINIVNPHKCDRYRDINSMCYNRNNLRDCNEQIYNHCNTHNNRDYLHRELPTLRGGNDRMNTPHVKNADIFIQARTLNNDNWNLNRNRCPIQNQCGVCDLPSDIQLYPNRT